MELLESDFQVLDREIYTFKQLKEQYSNEEIDQIKQTYKEHWQKWKVLQLTVATLLPNNLQMKKPKIESWTNGWNLRNHFWSAYRDPTHKNQNACLAVLLNKKQFQIYLMFQHYKSEGRSGSLTSYNELLEQISAWSKTVKSEEYYIWPQVESELVDHLPLTKFLADPEQPKKLKCSLEGRSFQIGKLLFKTEPIPAIEEVAATAIQELAPLYSALNVNS
ncbi:HI_0552 family protein [Enterococcus hermanniensis]|uniref:Glucose-6-phosphate 1-dehydrogenase n=1 Tax=Enterococcus hermanniensis TaxID=249189 RepID=A0A1L8TLD2_9ENTE|nr:HI_0552 family protein [Enterococcus hermanniensis]OJG44932.1 hypothetical protein RV04_GL000500 [Enterococcus hermanniensis]